MTGMAASERYLSELKEQPAAIERLADEADQVAAIAARAPGGTARVARRARLLGQRRCLRRLRLLAAGGLTAFRESISLLTYYGTAPDLRDSLVVAVSQSGRTPDVVDYVEAARGRAVLTVAVTNDGARRSPRRRTRSCRSKSARARRCGDQDLQVQPASLALLAGALGSRLSQTADGLRRSAALIDAAIPGLEQEVAGYAAARPGDRPARRDRARVEFATAREIALKPSETCQLLAEPLTSTALAHGPVARLGPGSPVWVVASDDPCLPSALEAAARARQAGAPLIASGGACARVAGAGIRLRTPAAPLPILAPMISVVPGQLFAWALALARGLDPDHPAGLSKVTVVP